MVMFLYRPEYYDITANEFGESNKGETFVKIAKHRNGSLDTIKLKALLHIQKFVEEADGGNSNFYGNGEWKPVNTNSNIGFDSPQDDSAKLFIQKGSKMMDGEFDEDAPF